MQVTTHVSQCTIVCFLRGLLLDVFFLVFDEDCADPAAPEEARSPTDGRLSRTFAFASLAVDNRILRKNHEYVTESPNSPVTRSF